MTDNADIDPETIRAILDKLAHAANGDEIVVFDVKEAEALQRFAKVWIGLEGVAFLGGALGSAVKWFLLIAASIIAAKSGFFEWVAEGLAKR